MPYYVENVVKIWNEEKNNIAIEDIRKVRFFFETDQGPGHVDSLVNKGVTIQSAKEILLETIANATKEVETYGKVEITKYEILEIYTGE